MKTLKILISSLVLMFLLFQACKKDFIEKDVPKETNTEESGQNLFNVTDQSVGTRSGEDVKTVLGNLRENPFTVEKMAQAHRNLYGSSIQTMETTHLYVKFMPASLDDMVALDSSDLFFFDFPLEYEVVDMGDYYQDIEEGTFPVLYTVASPDFVFPNVPHEVIAELYLDKSDPFLLVESFRITGNTDKIIPYVFPSSGLKADELGGNPVMLDIPAEPDYCDLGCYPVLQINTGTFPFTYTWYCDCPPPPPTPTNACGCPVFSSNRKPAGCVKVEDTELSTAGDPSTFLPVRRVKVIAYDGWFNLDITETDDNGCWKINDEYHGNAWFWIKFKNNRCKIRGTEGNFKAAWQWLFTVTDYVGKLPGPTYNNISVNYNMWTSNGSKAHRYWGAATVNNALHEFHDYAAQDGIAPPPNGMDIFVGHSQRYGYTIMSVQNQLSQAVGIALGLATSFTGPWSGLVALIGWGATQLYLPDIYIGTNFNHSDEQKSLAYHEIAHASHFAQVGPYYWQLLVTAEILANGHGSSSGVNNGIPYDAGLIALCESWAESLGGLLYTDRTYVGNNSLPFGLTWATILERRWNEYPGHVPIGLYNDLADVGEPTFNTGGVIVSACNEYVSGCTLIPDAVSGFTNAQMFSCLNIGTTSVSEFQSCLITNYLGTTGNTAAAVNTLFASY
jgi:hypothetical protein